MPLIEQKYPNAIGGTGSRTDGSSGRRRPPGASTHERHTRQPLQYPVISDLEIVGSEVLNESPSAIVDPHIDFDDLGRCPEPWRPLLLHRRENTGAESCSDD